MTTDNNTTPSKSLLTNLSMVGGLGMTLIVVGLGLGAIGGDTLDANQANLIGLAVVAGFFLLIAALVAWMGVVRPFDNFDDISVPLVEEHHDDH